YSLLSIFFFFNDTATTSIYTLSLHDALPIFQRRLMIDRNGVPSCTPIVLTRGTCITGLCHSEGGDPFVIDEGFKRIWRCRCRARSEEHTSELQSRGHLVCRLLLEKKKKNKI